jgi:hypothetical protein
MESGLEASLLRSGSEGSAPAWAAGEEIDVPMGVTSPVVTSLRTFAGQLSPRVKHLLMRATLARHVCRSCRKSALSIPTVLDFTQHDAHILQAEKDFAGWASSRSCVQV